MAFPALPTAGSRPWPALLPRPGGIAPRPRGRASGRIPGWRCSAARSGHGRRGPSPGRWMRCAWGAWSDLVVLAEPQGRSADVDPVIPQGLVHLVHRVPLVDLEHGLPVLALVLADEQPAVHRPK